MTDILTNHCYEKYANDFRRLVSIKYYFLNFIILSELKYVANGYGDFVHLVMLMKGGMDQCAFLEEQMSKIGTQKRNPY